LINERCITITNGLLDHVIQLKDWHDIWLAFAGYTLVIVIFFALLFKHKHNPKEVENTGH